MVFNLTIQLLQISYGGQNGFAWLTRVDSFNYVWAITMPFQEHNALLEAKALSEHLQRQYPGRFSKWSASDFERSRCGVQQKAQTGRYFSPGSQAWSCEELSIFHFLPYFSNAHAAEKYSALLLKVRQPGSVEQFSAMINIQIQFMLPDLRNARIKFSLRPDGQYRNFRSLDHFFSH